MSDPNDALCEQSIREISQELESETRRANAAEAELREVAGELEGIRSREDTFLSGRLSSLQKRLAEATALLELARDAIDEACYPVWWEQWRAFLSATPSPPAEPDAGPEQCPLHPGQDNGCTEPEDTESLIEQLDEALCTLLHKGDELGEHSPRTHLDLFYARSKAEPAPGECCDGHDADGSHQPGCPAEPAPSLVEQIEAAMLLTSNAIAYLSDEDDVESTPGHAIGHAKHESQQALETLGKVLRAAREAGGR